METRSQARTAALHAGHRGDAYSLRLRSGGQDAKRITVAHNIRVGDEGTMMQSREELWAEAMRAERRGDAAAYERLLKEIAALLRRLVGYRLAQLGLNAHETEDLVQEMLIGLHTKRHTWDESRPFLPWLHAIARYKLADAARRLRREARYRIDLTFDEFAELFEAPAEDLDRAVLDIDRHLSGLPQGQQAVVRALAIEGDTVRATARKLRTSEGAIRMTFHRALQRLTGTPGAESAKPPRDKL
jgi:RNA polymerase sigma factor (sigma-70 family)